MSEPAPTAWELASRKAWVEIDYDRLPDLTWIPCLPVFPEGQDRQSWAAAFADVWWRGIEHRKREVDNLAALLSAIHQDVYAAGHCHQAVIHLPDPHLLPLPVQLGVWAMAGEREEALGLLAHTADPEAIEPPIVTEFATDALGTGLKALHYRRGGDGTTLHGYLNYAWRSERFETDLRLFTFCWDLSRLQRAITDIDELARAISLVPRNGDGA